MSKKEKANPTSDLKVQQLSLFELQKDLEAIESYKKIHNNIQGAVSNIFSNYGRIGYYLSLMNESKLYEKNGYSSIIEYSSNEFDLSETTTRNVMAIYDRFFEKDDYDFNLKDKYKGFTYSALIELLSVPEEQLDSIKPLMTVKQIRSKKIEIEINEKLKTITGKNGFITDLINDFNAFDFNSKLKHEVEVTHEIKKNKYSLDERYYYSDKFVEVLFKIQFKNLPKYFVDLTISINMHGKINLSYNTKGINYFWFNNNYSSDGDLHKMLNSLCKELKDKLPSDTTEVKVKKEPKKHEQISSNINPYDNSLVSVVKESIGDKVIYTNYFNQTTQGFYFNELESKKNHPNIFIEQKHDVFKMKFLVLKGIENKEPIYEEDPIMKQALEDFKKAYIDFIDRNYEVYKGGDKDE